jgi:hypothetical protein
MELQRVTTLPAGKYVDGNPALEHIPLAVIVRSVVNRNMARLREEADSMAGDRRLTDAERKTRTIKLVKKMRHEFARLLVLIRWAQKTSKMIELGTRVVQPLVAQEKRLQECADELFYLHGNVLAVEEPLYDVHTAIDVLVLGTYPRLPAVMGAPVTSFQRLPLPDLIARQKYLSSIACLSETIPAAMKVAVTEDGTILARTQDFEVEVLVHRYQLESPRWYMVHWRSCIAENDITGMQKDGKGYPVACRKRHLGHLKSMLEGLMNHPQFAPFQALFQVSRSFSFHMLKGLLYDQSEALCDADSWKGLLSLETLPTEWILSYWQNPSYQIHISCVPPAWHDEQLEFPSLSVSHAPPFSLSSPMEPGEGPLVSMAVLLESTISRRVYDRVCEACIELLNLQVSAHLDGDSLCISGSSGLRLLFFVVRQSGAWSAPSQAVPEWQGLQSEMTLVLSEKNWHRLRLLIQRAEAMKLRQRLISALREQAVLVAPPEREEGGLFKLSLSFRRVRNCQCLLSVSHDDSSGNDSLTAVIVLGDATSRNRSGVWPQQRERPSLNLPMWPKAEEGVLSFQQWAMDIVVQLRRAICAEMLVGSLAIPTSCMEERGANLVQVDLSSLAAHRFSQIRTMTIRVMAEGQYSVSVEPLSLPQVGWPRADWASLVQGLMQCRWDGSSPGLSLTFNDALSTFFVYVMAVLQALEQLSKWAGQLSLAALPDGCCVEYGSPTVLQVAVQSSMECIRLRISLSMTLSVQLLKVDVEGATMFRERADIISAFLMKYENLELLLTTLLATAPLRAAISQKVQDKGVWSLVPHDISIYHLVSHCGRFRLICAGNMDGTVTVRDGANQTGEGRDTSSQAVPLPFSTNLRHGQTVSMEGLLQEVSHLESVLQHTDDS